MSLENKITINDIATSVTSLDNNFIPKGTIFTVKLDDSGDFTTFGVDSGGQIHMYGTTSNYTNVSNHANVSVGSVTNNGWITGV